MISLGPFLVFLLVLAIVSTYVALIRHFIIEAGEQTATPPPTPVPPQPVPTASLRPSHAH